MSALHAQPVHLLVAAGLLAALVLAFLGAFLLPGLVHWLRLRRLQRALAGFELRTPPGEFRTLFARDARLAHLWKEYQDSLHVQREERDGQMLPVAVRATLPAETFFNSAHVVDARLRTEFFKHLPGLFTGIGIIGTFTGLIDGLQHFQVSENAATVRASLESLMHTVGQAFLISASAIGAAMVVTFLEKLLLSSLYGRTEEIAHAIDARFDAGAGEDYLSRLVKSSEDATLQSKSLKDALVSELAAVLRSQTELQIKAARADVAGLASAISAGIERSLAAPLQKIANAVQTTGADQSAASARVLDDVMGRFAERLNDQFSGQAAGLNDLNRQTGQLMQEAVQSLRGMLTAADAHQRRAADHQHEREATLKDHATTTVAALSEMLGKAVLEMGGASTQMARSVHALTQTSSGALDRMNAGADTLAAASLGFATAGERVGAVMTQAAEVSATLIQASEAMLASATEMRGGLDDYRAHREAIGHVVTELRTTVDMARKEGALTADVLARIQQSSERLGAAQQDADRYLNSVSKVLGEAHQAFAVAVKKTLELANMEFHTKLSTAVGLLSSTVVELEATLGHAGVQKH
jgi:hypothetical protein